MHYPDTRSTLQVLLGCLLTMNLALAHAEEHPSQIVTERGSYAISYDTSPSPIPMNKPFEMNVTVSGKGPGNRTRKLDLEVDAGMRQHNHGMYVAPKVESLGDGRFKVRGMLFHMPGEWQISFVVKRGIMREKAEQEVTIK